MPVKNMGWVLEDPLELLLLRGTMWAEDPLGQLLVRVIV